MKKNVEVYGKYRKTNGKKKIEPFLKNIICKKNYIKIGIKFFFDPLKRDVGLNAVLSLVPDISMSGVIPPFLHNCK